MNASLSSITSNRSDVIWGYLCDARSAACSLADSYLRGLATRHELRTALDKVEKLRDEYHAAAGL